MKPGLHHNMPEREYHAHPAVNASGLKRILQSPAHYKLHLEPSDAMDLGSAVHTEVLGVGAPVTYIDLASWGVGAKKQREEIRAAGGIALLEKDREQVEGMAASVQAHPYARWLFSDGHPEVSAFCEDAEWRIVRRARFDWLRPDGVIVDLKTTRSADPRQLGYAVRDFGYDLSAAWYLDVAEALGHPAPDFALVFVESSKPYRVVVANLSPERITKGRSKYLTALERLRDCTEADLWPAYTTADLITIN